MKKFIKNFFFPTLQNNLRPYSLSIETFVMVVGLTFFLIISFCVYAIIFKINIANLVSSADTIPTNIISTANASFYQVIAYSRQIILNILLAFLVYVLLVLLVPMLVTLLKHRSGNTLRKMKETGTLFKKSIYRAGLTIACILALYVGYLLLSAQVFMKI